MAFLRGLWVALVRPSLVRRLVLAQLALVAVVWLAMLTALAYAFAHDDTAFDFRHRAEMVLAAAQALPDAPAHHEQVREVLAKIDAFERNESGDPDNSALRLSMSVYRHGELIYCSPGEPGPLAAPVLNSMQKVSALGRTWLVYSQRANQQDVQVNFVAPADLPALALSLSQNGVLLLPLLVSLPFLVFPAWISVRLALRPWRHLRDEIAARGPLDLAPLQFVPQHTELKPLVASVNGWIKRLASAMDKDRSFIADAAHELRTPIAAMRVNVEALHLHTHDAHTQELLAGTLRSVERASRLVGQLLSLMRSDSEASPVTQQLVAMDELAQDRLAVLCPMAARRGVELELELAADVPVQVRGEREHITSMLDNLIDNAIKYSPSQRCVQVLIQAAPNHPGQILVVVQDHGPGIPPIWHERVFDRFFRAPEQTQSGSGLGLSIVKSVVDHLGGRIELAGREDGRSGLRVSVWLPRAA